MEYVLNDAPLYRSFDTTRKQDSYLQITANSYDATYNPEVGNAVPMQPHVRIDMNPLWRGNMLDKFLNRDDVQELISRIQYHIEHCRDEYNEALEELEKLVASEERDGDNMFESAWRAAEWLENLSDSEIETLDPYSVLCEADADDVYIIGGVEAIEDYIEERMYDAKIEEADNYDIED